KLVFLPTAALERLKSRLGPGHRRLPWDEVLPLPEEVERLPLRRASEHVQAEPLGAARGVRAPDLERERQDPPPFAVLGPDRKEPPPRPAPSARSPTPPGTRRADPRSARPRSVPTRRTRADRHRGGRPRGGAGRGRAARSLPTAGRRSACSRRRRGGGTG